uniref:Chloroplast PsbO n=2 Tax=Chroomonas placoidea TaxID=173977 RepID=A0AAU8MMD0_9CRYP
MARLAILLGLVASAAAFTGPAVLPLKASNRAAACSVTMQDNSLAKKAAGIAAIPLSFLLGVNAANAITTEDIRGLTYSQVKGTGLANRCPEVSEQNAGGTIKFADDKKYKVTELCLEPKSFQIEEEVTKRRGETKKEFVDTKLMTRATYSLTGIEGPIVFKDGGLTFLEKGGIDYAATTVQLPGGERVPFLFTIKELEGKFSSSQVSAGTELGGNFKTPSYRTGLFLDPKGRGGTTGYDMAVALPGLEADGGEGQDELFAETNKVFQVTDGSIEMAFNRVDGTNGEFSGVFVSEQLSDTDMGSKAPKKVLLKGIVFGKIEEQTGDEDY